MLKNVKIIKIRPNLRVAIERQSFTTLHAYVTWVKTVKLTFFKFFHFKLYFHFHDHKFQYKM
jgi:hypothetical protein